MLLWRWPWTLFSVKEQWFLSCTCPVLPPSACVFFLLPVHPTTHWDQVCSACLPDSPVRCTSSWAGLSQAGTSRRTRGPRLLFSLDSGPYEPWEGCWWRELKVKGKVWGSGEGGLSPALPPLCEVQMTPFIGSL